LLPAPRPAPGRRAALALAALALVALPSAAFQLTSIRPARDPAGDLWVELRLEDPIEERVASSLERGMPATLTVRAELWRRRNGWFDRLERSTESTLRLRHDVGAGTWRLEHPGAPPMVMGSLDSLQIALARTLVVPVGSLARLDAEAPCYVVVTVSLRPLNLEDVEEVEGWISGEVRTKGGSGFGFLTGLPRSLFDAARNVAGFGDKRSRLISAVFTPSNLPTSPR